MSTSDAVAVDQTETIRNQGREHGLFRACMDTIRSSHTLGQTLRTAALTAGLLTDVKCYAELLGQFYLVTDALEERMCELMRAAENDKTPLAATPKSKLLLVTKVKALGYSFSDAYARDFRVLLGPCWLDILKTYWTTEPAERYMKRLQYASDAECVAAAFILYGPLIIGGGAMLKPRVERAFGAQATHVFADVTGSARGGRAARRREFINLYDTLLDEDDYKSTSASPTGHNATFTTIVQACGEFMELNNQMMMAVKQTPWWKKYVTASMAVVVAALIWRFKSMFRQ